MGKRDAARTQFDLILSGKTLEANAATRKGKYSLEVRVHHLTKTHNANGLTNNSINPTIALVFRTCICTYESVQSSLVMRTHAAIEALDHNKPL